VVALLLELVAIASYLLARMQSTDSSPGASKRVHRPRRHLTDAERGDTGTEYFNSRYEQAKQLIASGRVKPTLRALQRELQPIGQQTATRYLTALVDAGVLRRDGRRYILAQVA